MSDSVVGMDAYPLEDFMLTAAAVLGLDPHEMQAATKVGHAESALAAPFASYAGEAFYPDPVDRAAILASRIIGNHPLPDGNKRVALLCMVDLLELSGYVMTATQDERAEAIERRAGEPPAMSEEHFVEWVREHVTPTDADAAA